eukprot:XP_011668620.1 PREDICTED: uncharacterized protein LOC105440325 [Strongylocentrotus purpuratus]
MQVQTLWLHSLQCLTPASSHHLAEALCSLPNLTDLTLTGEPFTGETFTVEFYSALKAKALSIQGCFPQIRKGNFRFNGDAQDDLNSFLDTLTCLQRSLRHFSNLLSGMSAAYHTPAPIEPFSGYYCSPGFREASYNPTYHPTMSSSAQSPNPPVSRHDEPTMFAGYLSPKQYQPSVHESTGATHTVMPWSSQDPYTRSSHATPSSSALSCNPPVSGYHQPAMSRRHISDAPYQPMIVERSGSSRPPPSKNQSTTGFHSASHYPPIAWERTSRPAFSSQVSHSTNFLFPIQSTSSSGRDHPQQQPMGDVYYPRRTLPPSDQPQQQSMGDTTLNSNPWVMYTTQDGHYLYQTTLNSNPWVMYTTQDGHYLHQTTLNSMLAVHQILYVNTLRHTEREAAVGAGPARGKFLLLSQELHRMILKCQRSNQSMRSSCYDIGRVRQFPSGNTSS